MQEASPCQTTTGTSSTQSMGIGGVAGSAPAALPSAKIASAPVTIRSNDIEDGTTGAATGTTSPRGSVSDSTGSSGRRRDDSVGAPPSSGSQEPAAVRLSAFELFVRDTIGYTLPVFGRDLFNGSNAAFQAASAIAPADYVVGAGDELRIRSTGKVDIDVRAKVDATGRIFIPQVGLVMVAGTHADGLTEVVRRAVARQFKGFDLNVTLGQLRSVQILVLGQARRPGTYTVSALSSLVNALFASGGPSASGSLRDIQLIRNNETVAHFDVYRLLLHGDKSADRTLLAGDILYIPPVGPQVAIAGDVSTPAIYETNGHMTVGDLVADAAGLSPIAGTGRATLDRVENHQRRSVLNFALDGIGRATLLRDGDILRILPISPQIDDAVTLRGPVGTPGRYAWREGMRVHDLIPTRLSLLTRDYYNRKNALDLPAVATASTNVVSSGVASTGSNAGRNANQNRAAAGSEGSSSAAPDANQNRASAGSEGSFSAAPDATVDERTSAPPSTQHETDIDWTYATIERLNPADLKVNLLPFNLGLAIDRPDSADNQVLLPGDVVVLYSSRDLQLPLELTTKFVRIDGQVVAPGVYQVSGTETLRDLIRRAGGLAPHAYLYASQFTRESVRVTQEENLQRLLRRERTQAFSPSNVVTSGSGVGSAGATTGTELELRRAYLAELATMHATGRVVLSLRPDSRSVEDVPDLPLQDADHLFIPSLPNTVNVMGNVYNPGALLYVDHGRVKRYLNAAGGPEREADPGREFILRADGSLVSRAKIGNFDRQLIYPGDSIIVPANFKGRRAPINFLDLTTALGSLALTAVAVKALN